MIVSGIGLESGAPAARQSIHGSGPSRRRRHRAAPAPGARARAAATKFSKFSYSCSHLINFKL